MAFPDVHHRSGTESPLNCGSSTPYLGVGAQVLFIAPRFWLNLLMLTNFSGEAAVIGGIGLAMSSTAMAY